MLTILLLITLFGFLQFHSVKAIQHICSDNKPCFGYPDGCKVTNCLMVLAFSKTGTDIIIRDTDFSKFVSFYMEKNGERVGDYLVFFPGTTKCFMGDVHGTEPLRIKNKIPAKLTELDEVNGDYLYTFSSIIFETGPGVSYYTTKGYLTNNLKIRGGKKLKLISGVEPTTNLKDTERTSLTPLRELFTTYEAQIRQDYEHRKAIAELALGKKTNDTIDVEKMAYSFAENTKEVPLEEKRIDNF